MPIIWNNAFSAKQIQHQTFALLLILFEGMGLVINGLPELAPEPVRAPIPGCKSVPGRALITGCEGIRVP